MAGINRDLDRYLQRRSEGRGYTGPSWFDRMFQQAEREERKQYTTPEVEKLHEMEEEIEKGEHELEMVHELEEDLEERQEERVGFYHNILRLFQRKESEEELETVEYEEEDDDVHEDFKTLAAIQVRWLSRLPLRARQALKDSEDYQDMVEIYERRGVARRK